MEQTRDRSHEFFNKGELALHYVKWGKGKNFLLAFHGFSRTHEVFIPFTHAMQDCFTVVAVDIFFHGRSHIGDRSPDKNPLSETEFAELMTDFLVHIGAEKVWLMGHSLGGRLSLKMAELLPHRIRGMYLFAPDGLILNWWYSALSHYPAGRAAFRYFRRNNLKFMRLLRVMRRTGAVNDRTGEFVAYFAQNEAMHDLVYNTLTFLRKLTPNLEKLSKSLSGHHIPVDLFFGKNDQIIPAKSAENLIRLHPEVKLYVLNAAHRLLTAQIALEILRKGWMQLPDDCD